MENSINKKITIQLIMKLLTIIMAIIVVMPIPFISGSQYFWALFVLTFLYNIYLIVCNYKQFYTDYKFEMLFIISCLVSAMLNYKFKNIYSIVNTITTAILIFNLTTVYPKISKSIFDFETRVLDYFLILSTFILGFISIVLFIQNPINVIGGDRFSGIYLNYNQLGFWAFISFMLSVKHIDSKINIVNIPLELFLIFLAGSRSVFVSLLVFLFYLFKSKISKNKSIFLFLFAFILVIIVVISTLTRYQWLYKYISSMKIENIIDILSGYRYFIWKQILEIFIHFPIFGVGVNNINNAAKLILPSNSMLITGGWEDPHNIIVGLLTYTGIIGTILFFKIIYDKFKFSISSKQKYITISMICLLIISFFDIGIIFDHRILSVYFWYLIGQLNCIKFLERNINVEKN